MHRHLRLIILCFFAGGCHWLPPANDNAASTASNSVDGRRLGAGLPRAPIKPISFEDFVLLHDSGELLLLDARPTHSYHEGHIPGAIHLTARNSKAGVRLLTPDIKAAVSAGKTIVVYCSGPACRDARTLARRLAYAGFPVRTFNDGWSGWKNAGLEYESASHAPHGFVTPSAP